MKLRATALLLTVAALVAPAFAQSPFACRDGKTIKRNVSTLSVTIRPVHLADVDDDGCRLTVSRLDHVLLSKADWGFRISKPIGKDINNDGAPDVLIEGFTGGAHCCSNYWLFSASDHPYLAWVVKDGAFAEIVTGSDGKPYIRTEELGFDYFHTSHARSFMPWVFLRIDGKQLYDANSVFRADYDKEVAESRSALKDFKAGSEKGFQDLDEDVRFSILRLTLAYLYSGRPKEAWTALNHYAPASDRATLKREILEIRSNGLLRNALPLSKQTEQPRSGG